WQFTPTEAWADGEYDLTVQVTDTAGNSATSDALTVTIDTEAAATISIDDITDDNIINAAESNGQVTITGSVGGDAKAGDTVTLTVNGQDYTGQVQNDGRYSIEVDGSDLVSDADRTIVASVTGTDEAGNEFTATTDITGDNKDGDYDVDTGINKPNIDLMASSDSGDSNRDDLTHDNTSTFALGNIDSDVAGEAIVVMKDGQVVEGTLENVNGTWQFTPTEAWADGEYDLTVQVTDTAGNSATSDALTVTIDTEAAATIS
ncbi:MAG: Ig-like domain-containing protein, partial [Colwellia sp.]|nr:Ig-like domain-containing protein [Colwellia sp.]